MEGLHTGFAVGLKYPQTNANTQKTVKLKFLQFRLAVVCLFLIHFNFVESSRFISRNKKIESRSQDKTQKAKVEDNCFCPFERLTLTNCFR